MTLSESIRNKVQKLGLWFWVALATGLLILCVYIFLASPSFIKSDDLLVGYTEYSIDETDKININTAVCEQLELLNGIGEVKAAAIVKHREQYGDFIRIEDITDVEGISHNTFEGIKNEITV